MSLHIPKTAGTTLYECWKETSLRVSPKLKRRDIEPLLNEKDGLNSLLVYDVIHGHFFWNEVREWVSNHDIEVVSFLRHPVERVISNYRFFMDGLEDPQRNPVQYRLNKHRKGESLEDYATRDENRNRLVKHLDFEGLELCRFVGFVEFLNEDIASLMKDLGVRMTEVRALNRSRFKFEVSDEVKELVRELNEDDMKLYLKAISQSVHHDLYEE